MLAQSFSHHHDLSANRMTTSMVVTPPLRMQQSQPTSSQPPSRPRLSVNTSQARTFGKGSSLRLETLSAVSPTAINTFANAYEPERSSEATIGKPKRPKLSIDSSIPTVSQTIGPADTSEALDSRTPSSSSVSSASTLNSATIPYSISQVLNSVLANSPLQPRANIRRMSLRPRFPAEKKVSFRTPLVEEIVNIKYTATYSSLTPSDYSDTGSSISLSSDDTEDEEMSSSSFASSTDSSPESTLSLEQPTDGSELLPASDQRALLQKDPVRRRRLPHRPKSKTTYPQVGDKRDSSSESDSDSCPETPVAGRRKRRREWVWTLGSMPDQQQDMSTSTSEDDASSSTFSSSFTSTTTSEESS